MHPLCHPRTLCNVCNMPFIEPIGRIVYAAQDDKRDLCAIAGTVTSQHQISFGVMMEECSMLVKDFFKQKR